MNTTWAVNCQVTYTITQFFGNVTIGTASLNLGFRVSTLILSALMVVLTLAVADSRYLAK
jgi:hypothetical protein